MQGNGDLEARQGRLVCEHLCQVHAQHEVIGLGQEEREGAQGRAAGGAPGPREDLHALGAGGPHGVREEHEGIGPVGKEARHPGGPDAVAEGSRPQALVEAPLEDPVFRGPAQG